MDKQQQKLIKQKLNYQDHKHLKVKKNVVVGSLVATIIATTPYIFNLYQSVPNAQVWDTFLFTYNSGWYESANISAWTMMNKIVPLILVFLWFFTCRHWWYHALLVPIAMYIYHIFDVLNGDLRFADTNQVLYMLPLMAIIIPSIYLIRAKMFNKINDADKTLEELEEEFMYKPRSFRDYF